MNSFPAVKIVLSADVWSNISDAQRIKGFRDVRYSKVGINIKLRIIEYSWKANAPDTTDTIAVQAISSKFQDASFAMKLQMLIRAIEPSTN